MQVKSGISFPDSVNSFRFATLCETNLVANKTIVILMFDNNQFIIHRQSTALLSHDRTGLSSWSAAISLGDYLMKRIHLLENKRIIELGAGSGLLGLT
ncbi:unnamed protein product [Adineta steineri]|uniref:Uncharacterized protein n=1 Tax=Adineta steineri TaxID=433720 RepID=A0A815IBD7_9BILA|nr:unnamed protein product [Adineta steineri]